MKKIIRRVLFMTVMFVSICVCRKECQAAIYDDPVKFYNNYVDKHKAYYDTDTGWIYFGAKGKTASNPNGTIFRTVGYRMYINKDMIEDVKKITDDYKDTLPYLEVLLDGSGNYIKSYKETTAYEGNTQYTYVVRRAKVNKLRTLFSNKMGDVTYRELFLDDATGMWIFDAVMTVVDAGVPRCGDVRISDGKIDADNDDELYRFYESSGRRKGIADAVSWSSDARKSLETFYTNTVKTKPKDNLAFNMDISNTADDNVYLNPYSSNQYFVRKDSEITLTNVSEMPMEDVTPDIYAPDFNVFIFKQEKQANLEKKSLYAYQSVVPGAKSKGTYSYNPGNLAISKKVASGTCAWDEDKYYFTAFLKASFNVNDGEEVYVGGRADAYYKHNYPPALNNSKTFSEGYSYNTGTDNLVALADKDERKFLLKSDGTKPSVIVPSRLGVQFEGDDVLVPFYVSDLSNAQEHGSGVKKIRLYDNAGVEHDVINITDYNTQVVSEKYESDNGTVPNLGRKSVIGNLYISKTDADRIYYVEVTDNVGNINTTFFSVTMPVSYSIYNKLDGTVADGFNPSKLDIVVSGGSNALRLVEVISEDDENPSGERIVFVNKSYANKDFTLEQRSYNTTINPTQIIKNVIDNPKDGYYYLDIVAGGMFTDATPETISFKADFNGPEVHGATGLTSDSDSWINSVPSSFDVFVRDIWSGVEDFTLYDTSPGSIIEASGINKMSDYYSYKYSNSIPHDEGKHSYIGVAKDKCGNRTRGNLYYNLDMTPPTITLGEGLYPSEDDKYYVKSPFLADNAFYVTDNLSGLASNGSSIKVYKGSSISSSSLYNVNTLVEESVSSSHAKKIKFTIPDAISSQGNSYTIVATDRAGNKTQKTITVYYDSVPPQLFVDGGGSTLYNNKTVFRNDMITHIMNTSEEKVESGTVGTNIKWTDDYAYWYNRTVWYSTLIAIDDSGNALSECYLECIDNGKKVNLSKKMCTAGEMYNRQYIPRAGICYRLAKDLKELVPEGEGNFKCRLYAKDRAGNVSEYIFYVRLDYTVPTFLYESTSGTGVNGWNEPIPGKAYMTDYMSGIKVIEAWGSGKRQYNSQDNRAKEKTFNVVSQYNSVTDVYLLVKDYAGNEGKYYIKKTDTGKPTINISQLETEYIDIRYPAGDTFGFDSVQANPEQIDFTFKDNISGLAYCEVSIAESEGIENLMSKGITENTKWTRGNPLNNSTVPYKEPGVSETISINTSSWDGVNLKLKAYCVDVAGNESTMYTYVYISRTSPTYEVNFIDTTGEEKWNPREVEIVLKGDHFGIGKAEFVPWFMNLSSTLYTYIPLVGNTLKTTDFIDEEHRIVKFRFDAASAVEHDSHIEVYAKDYIGNETRDRVDLYIDHTLPYVLNEEVDVISAKRNNRYEFSALNCKDDISGVKECYVRYFDTADASKSEIYQMNMNTDDTGTVFFDFALNEADLPFDGSTCKFEIHLVDKAGNDALLQQREITDFNEEMTLSVSVRRNHNYSEEKYKKSFVRGEMGFVDFVVTGNAERLVFDFPDNLDVEYDDDKEDDGERMDGELIINNPQDVYTSVSEGTSHRFFVPITLKNAGRGGDDSIPGKYIADYLMVQDYPEKTYPVTVTAYRTVNGVEESVTVTDDFSIKRFSLKHCVEAVAVTPSLFEHMGWNGTQDLLDYWNNDPRNDRLHVE